MHKYLLDENLSRKLVDKLAHVYPKISHVAIEGLANKFDVEIWQFAKNNNLIIITKDNDFSDMSHLYSCPPKVIKLNCGNKNTEYIFFTLSANQKQKVNFAESANCYLEIL